MREGFRSISAMWGRKKNKTSDVTASTSPTQATAKLDHTIVSSGKSKRSFSWSKLSKKRKIILLAVVVLAAALLVTAVIVLVEILRKDPVEPLPTTEQATTEMLADFYKRRDEQAQQASPEVQIGGQFKTYEDKITNNQAGNDDNERFTTYSQAAFLGARLNKSQAAEYAKKALGYSNTMDKASKEASAGLIKSLEAVAKGDYHAFTQ